MAVPKRKLVLRIFAVLVIGLLALVTALPVWLPWVLRPVARSLGLSYAEYERDGYGRFRLTRLQLKTAAGTFQAQQAEAFVPSVWGWNLITGETNAPFLSVKSWEFVSQAKLNQTAPRSSVYTNLAKGETTLGVLTIWLPRAEFTNGSVRVSRSITSIPRASWLSGKLTAQAVLQAKVPVKLSATYQGRNTVRLSVASTPWQVHSEFVITNTVAEMQIAGTVRWLSNRVEVAAHFPPQGFLPETASLRADSFQILGDALELKEYKDLVGSLRADWSSNRFKLDFTAKASPLAINLQEIDIEVHASGNTNIARVDAAKVTLPWINAELTEATTFQFTPPFLPQPARLRVSADVAKLSLGKFSPSLPSDGGEGRGEEERSDLQMKQPLSSVLSPVVSRGARKGSSMASWLSRSALTGTLAGTVTVFPAQNKFPRVAFLLTGSGISVSNVHTKALRLEGEFDWPRATLSSARLTTVDGSEAVLKGMLNVAEKRIEQGTFTFAGGLGQRLLPAGYNLETAEIHAQFSGPLADLTHSGALKIKQLQLPHAHPIQLSAEWNGRGLEFSRAAMLATAGTGSVEIVGSFYHGGKTNELAVSALLLHSSSAGEMRLEKPFRIAFATSETNAIATNAWTLQMQPLRWHGGERELSGAADVNWPKRGNLQVSARNLDSGLFEDFITLTNAAFALDDLALNAAWTNGPLNFELQSSARLKTESGYAFAANSVINGGEAGVSIAHLAITSATQVVAQAEGFLPIFLKPSSPEGRVTRVPIHIQTNGLLQLRAFMATNSVFWEDVASKSPLRLINPRLFVDVTGSWAKPQGQVRAAVERIELRSAKPVPPVEDFLFNLDMNRDQALATLNAAIRSQPVAAKAQIPLGQGFWTGLGRKRWLPDLREVTGEVIVQNAQLAAFVEYAPEILSPQGEFSLDLKMKTGNQLAGKATLYNAGTRPLGPLGPVRAIDAEAVFAGSNVVLTVLSGEIGGQRITATGSAQLDDQFWRVRKLPPFQLRFVGTNVPLVRQAGVRVRADVDMAITNTAASNATVSGSVHVRDSFLLSGLPGLAPGKVASVKRRPPYFSIETEPLAHWRLNVQVDGEKFLKVQSPIFRGIVSTTLRLEGTLKEPVALGEARVNSGSVIFPFGSLAVQQGFVSLTSDTLYHPQLFVSATGQRMGYDLRLEITGSADKPILQFSSSPPLSSEQIVLMLTTGQVPQGVAGISTGRRAQGIALFMGKSFLSDLGIGGAGEERLSIRSGEQVTEAGRPTYEVEYKLSEDWSLIGEYDRFSQYDLSLKWKVYVK